MIDPVSLIVGALVAALNGAAKEIGRAAAHDAYGMLRDAIINRYGNGAAARIAQLEAQPSSPPHRTQLEQFMRGFPSGYAEELVPLANTLMLLVEDGPIIYSVDHAKRTAGANAVYDILEYNTNYLADIRSRYNIEDSDLLSSRISQAPGIPARVRADIGSLHAQMRAVIEHTAALIEERGYLAAEDEIARLQAFAVRDRAWRLVEADKQLHISYETLRLTVDLFGNLNSRILRRLDRSVRPDRELQMMFGNAVMVYEVADFTINYIENFMLRGTGEIDELHEYMIQRIENARRAADVFSANMSASAVEEHVKAGTLENVRYRQDALNMVEEEWGKYVKETRRFSEQIGSVRTLLPTLEAIREDAWQQLDVLEIMAMVRFLKLNSSALKAAVETLTKFQLARLTPERVRRLLNIEGPRVEGY